MVEGLFEALMAARRFNWHATVLNRYLLDRHMDSTCKDVIEALLEALGDQRRTVLAGSSSAIYVVTQLKLHL